LETQRVRLRSIYKKRNFTEFWAWKAIAPAIGIEALFQNEPISL
jgi:hypothetical protein